MPTTEFEKRKGNLISDISNGITEDKELEALFSLFNKLMTRKAVKARKALKANSGIVHPFYSRTRVPTITSLLSANNISHEEALQELDKIIESWK